MAFSVIYDHLNLLIQPGKEYNISKVMQSIKKEVSRDINYIMGITNEGDIPECRLRGYQYSPRYDKNFATPNLWNYRNQFINKYGANQNQIPKFKWQKSFRDHIIRNEKDLEKHFDYTVYNHLKHGLPENWQYTSLNYPDLID